MPMPIYGSIRLFLGAYPTPHCTPTCHRLGGLLSLMVTKLVRSLTLMLSRRGS